jgi:hypothetical protein
VPVETRPPPLQWPEARGSREKMNTMEDQSGTPAPNAQKPALPTRKTGLSPAQQKLQAALEKAANAKAGTKGHNTSTGGFKAKSTFAGKKTAFQRKAT